MKNINFFKKLWWSITKVSKYDEMSNLGFRKAVKYFTGVIAIMALVLSLVGTCIQVTTVQEVGKYVNDNIPEFKLENTAEKDKDEKYKLELDNNEVIILDKQNFINIFKNIIVVNTNIKEKEAIQEYYNLATNENNCTILLKDKCIIISSKYNPENENKDEGITKYTYLELKNNLFGTQVTEVNKNSIMGIFNNVSYTYYVIMYFVNYFIVLLTIFALDAIIIGIITMIIFRISKTDITKKQIFSLSMYSLTLPIIFYNIYLIINYFAKFNFSYINALNMIIAIVYIMIYFYRKQREKNIIEEK